MGDKTKIQWAEATWNPTTGCDKVSAGCKNCYAEGLAEKFKKQGLRGYEKGFQVKTHRNRLDQPRRWVRGRRVFVNSMSDLFHEKIPFDFILEVWEVMVQCPHHTFMVLTKRPERAAEFFEWKKRDSLFIDKSIPDAAPNIYLGVSVEDQETANSRIPKLLQLPAQTRFLSCEPLLGPVTLTEICCTDWDHGWNCLDPSQIGEFFGIGVLEAPGIDWVIVGGESGPRFREMKADWVRTIRDECAANSVPFFFKQWASARKKKGPCLLDGVAHEEFPTKFCTLCKQPFLETPHRPSPYCDSCSHLERRRRVLADMGMGGAS